MIPKYLSEMWTAIAPAVGNHLWQSTLLAVVAGLLTLALRKNHARARYWLWMAASVKFLIPFSLLVGVGSRVIGSDLGWSRAAAQTKADFYFAMDEFSQPFTQPVRHVVSRTAPAPPAQFSVNLMQQLPAILAAVWLLGFVVVICVWCMRWRRMSAKIRMAVPLNEGREVEALRRIERAAGMRKRIELLLSRASLEPGIFGIARPVLVWPHGISERLEDAHVEAILAHEVGHVRRRDNLAAAIHMLVEAIFWFHPLVWWIGARLVEEREVACDEGVLELGSERQVYAESILKICEFCVGSPLACVSGVTGADLKKRIVRIMAGDASRNLDFSKKFLIVASGLMAVAIPFVFGLSYATPSRAQSASAAALPQFEVASVKPHAGGMDRTTLVAPTLLPSGRFVFRMPLPVLISYAYKLPFNLTARWTGLPDWTRQAIYDIEATSAMPDGLSVQARDERARLMVQALLADRFRMAIHRESKEMPVYALEVAKGGPKLQRADIDEKDCPEAQLEPLPPAGTTPFPVVCHSFNGGMGRGMHARAVDMSDLARCVESWTDRPLVDKTGITGLYRIETSAWLPMDVAAGPNTPDLPTLYEVLDQLGLKMVPQKGVVDVYVIDHLEKPTEN
jgi:bla regulator protein BlaR1